MKKYFSALFFVVLFLPTISYAQVSSTVQKRVVPVLKKSYETTAKSIPSPVKAQSNSPRAVLKQGMKGEDVRYLQAWLFNQGFDLHIDGIFGPGTKRALINFQKSTNGALNADGVFGPRTALYLQEIPAGVAIKNLDTGTVNYLKGKHIATITGKEVNTKNIIAASNVKSVPNITSKLVLANLPKDVKVVLEKALPQAPKLTAVQVADTNIPINTVKTTTKKPKADLLALISKAKVSLVTATGAKDNLFTSSTLNTNFSSGISGQANKEYICAEWGGDNTCVAVSPAIASAVKAGQLDARDVLAEILGNDGQCPFCSKDENGGLVLTSGGGCGAAGGPGSGEFITPPGTPVGTDPNACIPFTDISKKAYSMAVTSDNVFTAYWGIKDIDGNETLQVIGKDMNWDESTSTGTSTHPGWKSAESFSGTAPANISNIYFATFHDGWVTHGFLGSLSIGDKKYETGSSVFEVTKTTVPGPLHPNEFPVSEVLQQIKNGTWSQTYLVGDGEHGMYPWGKIPGIPLSAKWIFEGSDWDPEGLMANYEIYKLKICDGPSTTTITEVTEACRGDAAWPTPAQEITANFAFSEPVYVTGVPSAKIIRADGNEGITLNYVSGSGTNILKFTYTVPSPLPAGFSYTKQDFEGDYAFKLPLPIGASIKTGNGAVVNLDGRWTAPPAPSCPIPDAPSYEPSDVAVLTCFSKSVTGNSGNKTAVFTLGTDKPLYVQGIPKIKAWSMDTNPPAQVTLDYITGSITNKIKFKAIQALQPGATDESFDFVNINNKFQFQFANGSFIKTLASDGLQLYPHSIAMSTPNIPECAE